MCVLNWPVAASDYANLRSKGRAFLIAQTRASTRERYVYINYNNTISHFTSSYILMAPIIYHKNAYLYIIVCVLALQQHVLF